MRVLEIVAPVLFMILLGFLSRVTGYITREQADGAKQIAIKVLFPFLIYNATFHAELRPDYILVIAFVFAAYLVSMFVVGRMGGWVGAQYKRVAGFLVVLSEGGGVALPLYITLVAKLYMVNIVMFDIAGMLTVLCIIAYIERHVSGAVSVKTVVMAVIKNPIIIATILGFTLNALGVGRILQNQGLIGLNDAVSNMIITPIEGIILFVLGYEIKLQMHMIGPLLRMLVLRLIVSGAIIGGFFLLFADRMLDQPFKVAVILYFLSPPSFMMATLLGPFCENDEQKSLISSYLPLHVLLTIGVYIALAVTVGVAPT